VDCSGGNLLLQSNRIRKRIDDNHNAKIIAMCNDPDSSGRMVENIVTNTLLPALSRHILNKSMAGEEITEARVEVKDGEFGYGVE
jgi:type VI secretion system protein VasG